MPSRVIGPQRYGVSDCPVFVAALWRTGENPPPITRDDIESITFAHYKKCEPPAYARLNFYTEAIYYPLPGMERLELPISCFFNERIQCTDTFTYSGNEVFPYNFLFVPTNVDLVQEIGNYRSNVEVKFFDVETPEVLIFDIEVIKKFTGMSLTFGEQPRIIGSLFAKQVNSDGTLTEKSPAEVVTSVFRTVKKNGTPVGGQNSVPVEVMFFDPPKTMSGEDEMLSFMYNFEHRSTNNIFPEPGSYDVLFDFYKDEKRIGTSSIALEVMQ